MRVEVEIARVYLVIEKKRERLTKAIARQFPVKGGARWDAAVSNAARLTPICKVRGKSIMAGAAYEWLYLQEDEEAGLVWSPPCIPHEGMKGRLPWWDEPSDVMTAIL